MTQTKSRHQPHLRRVVGCLLLLHALLAAVFAGPCGDDWQQAVILTTTARPASKGACSRMRPGSRMCCGPHCETARATGGAPCTLTGAGSSQGACRARLPDGRLDLPPGRRRGGQHLLGGAGGHAVAGAVGQRPGLGQERRRAVQDAAAGPPEPGAGLGAKQDRLAGPLHGSPWQE